MPKVIKDPVTREYDWLTLDDCTYMSKPGHPALPVRVVVFKVNLGYEILGVTVETSTKALDGTYNVMPTLRPFPLGHEEGLTDPDPTVYSSDELYPGRWYSYRVGVGIDPVRMVRIKYVTVHLYPLRYVPTRGKITRLEKVTITVNYSGSPTNAPSSIDLLIITSPALESQASSLASYRNSTGLSAIVRTTDWIYNHYSGTDNQERIRSCINDAANTIGIKYILIFGDADQVPVRMAYIPDGYDDGGTSDGSVVETDLYYADLQYTWDDNNDGRWGDPQHDQIDGIPDVYIGRLPVSTTIEASDVLNKIIDYEQNVGESASWFMRALLLGTNTFGRREGEILCDYIRDNFVWGNFTVTKLYETMGALSGSGAKGEIDDGYGLVNFAGHGSWDCWWFGGAEWYFDGDALGQINGLKTATIFAMACLTSRFSDRDCIGEAFVLNPDGGAVAYFGSTRVAWGYTGGYITSGLAPEMDWRFWKALYDGETIAGKVWGQATTQYVHAHPPDTYYSGNGYLDWKTAAEYGSPFTDPTLRVCARFLLNLRTKDWAGRVLKSSNVTLSGSPSKSSDSTGWANFTTPSGTHTVSVSWLGPEVNQTAVTIGTSSMTLDLKCHVYDLIIEVRDVFGFAVSGAEVKIRWPDGTLLTSGATDSAGRVTFIQLPWSDYKVDVAYQLIWTQTTTETMSLTSTITKGMRVSLSPPGLGISVGVPLIVIAVVALITQIKRGEAPPSALIRPAQPMARFCPYCHHLATYIPQRNKWYCSRCRRYVT